MPGDGRSEESASFDIEGVMMMDIQGKQLRSGVKGPGDGSPFSMTVLLPKVLLLGLQVGSGRGRLGGGLLGGSGGGSSFSDLPAVSDSISSSTSFKKSFQTPSMHGRSFLWFIDLVELSLETLECMLMGAGALGVLGVGSCLGTGGASFASRRGIILGIGGGVACLTRKLGEGAPVGPTDRALRRWYRSLARPTSLVLVPLRLKFRGKCPLSCGRWLLADPC